MKQIKIVADSGCDVSLDFVKEHNVEIVPLIIDVNDKTFIDDFNIDIEDMIKNIKLAPTAGKSSCPSPQAYFEAFGDASEIFVVTLSSTVSGSNNSACIAKDMYLTKNPKAKIHIFDTSSASAAETLVVHEIVDCIKKDYNFEKIISHVTNIINSTKTYFILDDMDTLIKNGRIRGLKAFLVGKLNIKAIMTQKNGEIVQAGKGHGIIKALSNLAEIVKKDIKLPNISNLYISHVNAFDKVEAFIDSLKKINCYDIFNKIIIDHTRGLSSFYANDGGIIIAFTI